MGWEEPKENSKFNQGYVWSNGPNKFGLVQFFRKNIEYEKFIANPAKFFFFAKTLDDKYQFFIYWGRGFEHTTLDADVTTVNHFNYKPSPQNTLLSIKIK